MQRRRSNENEIFNLVVGLIATLLLGTLLMAALAGVAHAEDKKDAKPPESVTLSAEVVRDFEMVSNRARIADLEAQNLEREIRLRLIELEKMKEAAKKAQEAANGVLRAAIIKAGVPPSDVDLYDGAKNEQGQTVLTDKGELVLKRKVVAPPKEK